MSSLENKESILKGVVVYSISTWANVILGFLSVVILTRVIKPDVYGLTMMFLSASSVLLYVFTLGTDSAYIRFYNEPPQGNTKTQLLYKNLIWGCCLCLIVGCIICLILGNSISGKIFGIESRWVVFMLLIYTICSVGLRYLNISFRMSFNAKKYNIQNILMNCAGRFLIIIAAIISSDFNFIVTILTIGYFIVYVVYLIIQRKEFIPINENGERDFTISYMGFSEYFKYALFSAPTYIVVYLNTFLGQNIINSRLDAYALGIFTSTGAFSAILGAMKGGFSTYWSAYTYKNYNDEQERIKKMHDFVVFASIIMASILVMGRDFVYLFIGKDFHESKNIFSLLLAMPILSFALETTQKGIEIAKKNQITLLNYIISVSSNLALCFLLIKPMGILGAAYANAVSAVILYILNTVSGQKYYRTISSYPKSIRGILLLVSILVFPSIFANIWIIICFTLLIDIITFVSYKQEVEYSFNIVKNLLKRR